MPFIYYSTSYMGSASTDLLTNATPNTETDNGYLAFDGTNANDRGIHIQAVYCGGKSAGLTVISGISIRLKNMNPVTTGSVIQPIRRDPGVILQESANFGPQGVTSGWSNGSAITPGTFSRFVGGFTFGATGPGGWQGNANSSLTPDSIGGGNSATSIDLFSASGTASMKYEAAIEYAAY